MKGFSVNTVTRGIRNAFRNGIRAAAIIGMLALSIGLALSMLLANQAVAQKIESVQKSIGTTITIMPSGIRGFQGGGDPLTGKQLEAIKKAAHVTSVDSTLTDRLESDKTNLVSSIEPGQFGKRQFRINSGFTPPTGGGGVVIEKDARDDAEPDLSKLKLPVTVIGASNPLAAESASTGGQLKLTEGKSFDGTKDAAVALVGKQLAEKNSLKTGSTFTAYGITFTVSGIYDAGNEFTNSQLVMPLPTVQRLSDQADQITSAVAHVDSSVNLDAATTFISNELGNDADVTNGADSAKAALSSLENIKNVSLFSLIGAAVTAAVIILLTMIMIVRERRREIGVLKAIGGSNVRVIGQFTVEALTLTIAAAIIGIIIGSLGATPVTKMLADTNDNTTSSESTGTVTSVSGGPALSTNGPGPGGGIRNFIQDNGDSAAEGLKNLKANVDISIVAYGLGAAVMVAIVGSAVAAGLIAKVRPAEVMRAE
jgi:putative ABC transport system permease protein